jgi:hypothetical protein
MFLLRDSRSTWFLYTALLATLTFVSFGSLLEHPFSTDDFAYLSDAAAMRQDPSFLLSANQALPGRPIVSLVFLLANLVGGTSPALYHFLLIGLHFSASLMLTYTFRRLGANLELCLLGGLLFSINVAHFRAVQWISCLAYPLVLILSLATLLLFKHFLSNRRLRWLFAAYGLLILAIFTHASALSAALFCSFLAWRHGLNSREIALYTGPLCAVLASILRNRLLGMDDRALNRSRLPFAINPQNIPSRRLGRLDYTGAFALYREGGSRCFPLPLSGHCWHIVSSRLAHSHPHAAP